MNKRHKWTADQIAFIKQHYPTLGSRFCSDQLGVSVEVVKSKANYMGICTLPKSERLCKDCNIEPTIHRSKCCRECQRNRNNSRYVIRPRKIVSDIDAVAKVLAKNIRHRNKVLHNELTKVTADDIKTMYETQNGKCFYTGRNLKLKTDTLRDFDLISVDRLDSSKPYVDGNMVLTLWGVNKIKNDLPVDYFLSLCRDIAIKHNGHQ